MTPTFLFARGNVTQQPDSLDRLSWSVSWEAPDGTVRGQYSFCSREALLANLTRDALSTTEHPHGRPRTAQEITTEEMEARFAQAWSASEPPTMMDTRRTTR